MLILNGFMNDYDLDVKIISTKGDRFSKTEVFHREDNTVLWIYLLQGISWLPNTDIPEKSNSYGSRIVIVLNPWCKRIYMYVYELYYWLLCIPLSVNCQFWTCQRFDATLCTSKIYIVRPPWETRISVMNSSNSS